MQSPIANPRLLRTLSHDGRLLFATRSLRFFAYGFIAVVLGLYLEAIHLSKGQIGSILSLTLIGDTVISLWLTTAADRLGRRHMLLAGAALMLAAGLVFAMTANPWLLALAGTIGVISPSGNEVGPFLSIEQASLSHVVSDENRTGIFAWYTLAGALATALGSLAGGLLAHVLQKAGFTDVNSYRVIIVDYAVIGAVLAMLFARLSPGVEPAPREKIAGGSTLGSLLGISHSAPLVLPLAALFALDALGGGFVITTLVAVWFQDRWHTDPALLGAIFFGANVLAGFSALAAGALARRIGLVNTMVFTHLPSNVLLILVPFMPTQWLAVVVLWLRFSISQMDVPTRQSYTMAVVPPHERAAAAGVTNVIRSTGAAVAPRIATPLYACAYLAGGWPFVIGGGLKILYDLLLYRRFKAVKPPEER